MINKAIEKITTESQAIGDSLSVFMEEYLTNKCTSEAVAKKLLAEDKAFVKVHSKVLSKARKQAVNGQAHIPDEEIYEDLDEYYELEKETNEPKAIDVMDLL